MLLKLSLSSFLFTNFLFFKKNYRRQLFYLSWVNNQLHSLRTAPTAFLPLRRFITQSRFCGNSISSFSFVYLCLSSFRVFYSFGSFFGNFKSLSRSHFPTTTTTTTSSTTPTTHPNLELIMILHHHHLQVMQLLQPCRCLLSKLHLPGFLIIIMPGIASITVIHHQLFLLMEAVVTGPTILCGHSETHLYALTEEVYLL